MQFKLNSSNPWKLAEYKKIFQDFGVSLSATEIDLPEIDADPLTVITHKASQVEDGVIVEDTSLEVEGAEIGVNIKWLLDHLENYVGHKAVWTVLLAFKQEEMIHIYCGKVHGTIVQPKEKIDKTTSFGFDPVFCPEGCEKTLAEDKPDSVNARALAVEELFQGEPLAVLPPILHWDGPWQRKD